MSARLRRFILDPNGQVREDGDGPFVLFSDLAATADEPGLRAAVARKLEDAEMEGYTRYLVPGLRAALDAIDLATPAASDGSLDVAIGLDASLFPHRGSWRHSQWCSFERGDDTSCTCGLDYLRRSLNYEGDEPDARPAHLSESPSEGKTE